MTTLPTKYIKWRSEAHDYRILNDSASTLAGEVIELTDKLEIALKALEFYAYEVDWLRLDIKHARELRAPSREALEKMK